MKRFVSLLLSVMIMINLLPVSAFAAVTPTWDWSGYTPISTQAELQAIADDLDGKYYLTQDISLSGSFSVIGSSSRPFTGVLDGNGYSIQNMKITYSGTAADQRIGLFAVNNGTIRNLSFDSAAVNITSYKYSQLEPRRISAGVIAGWNNGSIINCSLKNTSVLNVKLYSSADIGGIAGNNNGTIKLCTNAAVITVNGVQSQYVVQEGTGGYRAYLNSVCVGGIAGQNSENGSLLYCANNGAVTSAGIGNDDGIAGYAGGIAGAASGTVSDCSNTATVYLSATDSSCNENVYVGGIAGSMNFGTISRCENTGRIDAKGCWVNVGGITGELLSSTADSLHNSAHIYAHAKAGFSRPYPIAELGGIIGYMGGSSLTNAYNDNLGILYARTSTDYFYTIYGGYIVGSASGDPFVTGSSVAEPKVSQCYNVCYTYGYDTAYANAWCAAGIIGSSEQMLVENCVHNSHLNSYRPIYFCDDATVTNNVITKDSGYFDEQATFTGFDFENIWTMSGAGYNFPSFKSPVQHTHSKFETASKAASCGGTAKIKAYRCSSCDTYFRYDNSAATIDAAELNVVVQHSFGDWAVTRESTCTTAGTQERTCFACQYTENSDIPLKDHTAGQPTVNVVKAPGCTTFGETLITTYCTVCTGEISSETIYPEATGHLNTSVVPGKAPTCAQTGLTDGEICNDCGQMVVEQEDIPASHSFTNYINNPDVTCTTDGTKTAICDNCDATDTIFAEKLGHSFTNYVSNGDATCSSKGTETAKCDRCDETDTRTDESTTGAHSFKNYVFNGDGTKTGTCEHCGETETIATDILAQGICGPDAYFKIYEDSRMFITGNGEVTDCSGWDNYRSFVTHLDIADGITLPGFVEGAFTGFTNLEYVKFTQGLPSLHDGSGTYLFKDSPKLKTAGPVGSGCDIEYTWKQEIPYYAFEGTPVESVIIPDTVKEISYYSFYDCYKMTSITIPNGVEKIGHHAFGDCDNLNKVIIPESVTTMEFGGTFGYSYLLKTAGPIGSGCNIEFGWTTTIPDYAFESSELETIFLPATITSIGDCAFRYSESLTDIYYGGSKTQFDAAFTGEIPYGVTVHYGMYDITVVKSENGTLSVDKSVVEPNETVTITAIPDQCYAVSKIYINGTEITGDTFTAEKDSTVKVEFVVSHTEVIDKKVEPTCTETGKTEGSHCSVCGDVLTAQETIGKLGHRFTDYVSDGDATCTQDGHETAKCDRCDATDTRVAEGSMVSHVFENYEIIQEPTCISYGSEEARCENCEATDTQPIDMLAHNPQVIPAISVTCLTEGWSAG